MFKATHKHDSFVRTLAAWPCSNCSTNEWYSYSCIRVIHAPGIHKQSLMILTKLSAQQATTCDESMMNVQAIELFVVRLYNERGEATVCNYDTDWWVKTPAPPAAAAANWTSKYGEGEKNKNIQTPLSGRTFREKLTAKKRRTLQIFQLLAKQFKLGKQRFRNRCTCTYTKEPNCKAWPPALLRERIKQCAIKCWS